MLSFIVSGGVLIDSAYLIPEFQNIFVDGFDFGLYL